MSEPEHIAEVLERTSVGLSAEQRKVRLGRIGASQAAAIVGCDPYKSEHDVYAEILGASKPAGNEHTDLGHLIEEPLARLYARRRGVELVRGCTLTHPKYPWLCATPDYGVARAGVAGARQLVIATPSAWRMFVERGVELKNVGFPLQAPLERCEVLQWGPTGDPDGVPDRHRLQVVVQMAVTGSPRADVVALLGGSEMRVYTIERDEALEKVLVRRLELWYHAHIVPRRPPAPDGSEGARKALEATWPKERTPLRAATSLETLLAAEYDRLRAIEAAAKHDKECVAQRLCQCIGEGEGVRGRGWYATWKKQDGGAVNWKALALHLGAKPEQVAEFQGEGTRTLHVRGRLQHGT